MLRKWLPAVLLACAADMTQAAILMVPESAGWVVLSPQESATPASVTSSQRAPGIDPLPEYQGLQGFKLWDEVTVSLLEPYDGPVPVALSVNGTFLGKEPFPTTTIPISWNFFVSVNTEEPSDQFRAFTTGPDYTYEFCMTVDGRSPSASTTCSGPQQGFYGTEASGWMAAAVTPNSNPQTWSLLFRIDLPSVSDPVTILIPQESIDVNVAAPVPEPSTAWLLLLGAGAIIWLKRA